MDAQAEQQVSEGVDDDDGPGTGVHDALERGGDARGDERQQVGAKASEDRGNETKDGEREQHRNHDIEGVGNRGRHALAKVDLDPLHVGELDEERHGKQADDDRTKEAVGARVGRGKGPRGVDAGERVALGHAERAREAADGKARRSGGLVGGVGGVDDVTHGGDDGLRHHDDERGDADDDAGNGVLKALVDGKAVAKHAGQDDGGKVEGAEANPTLGRW